MPNDQPLGPADVVVMISNNFRQTFSKTPDDIKLMVNRSQKKVICHEKVEKADDACPKNSPAGIHGVVVTTSEIYV